MLSLQALVGAEVGRPLFRYEAADDESQFFVDDSYCSESGCEGDEVAVRLSAVDGSETAVRLRINLRTRRARWDADVGAEEGALAHAFAHDEGMLRLLERRHQLSRAWRAAQQGPAGTARRPAESRLYALGEFGPGVEQFAMPFVTDGEAWAAFDHYCVAPHCSCEKVVLDFYGPVGRSSRREVQFEFGVRLDLTTGEAEGQAGAALTAEQRRVLVAFQDEVEGWQQELSTRRRLAREAARHQLSRDERTSARASPGRPGRGKTGRNERCPCGSGRKYKRCCGRVVARSR